VLRSGECTGREQRPRTSGCGSDHLGHVWRHHLPPHHHVQTSQAEDPVTDDKENIPHVVVIDATHQA
jgi:hypothetical protein